MSSIRSKVQLLAVVLACAAAACGDDDDTDGEHADGHGGATAGSGGGGAAGKAGSAGGAAGKAGGGGGAAPAVDCDTYCDLAVGMMCTGDLEVYADKAACEEGCEMIETKGAVTDTEGNTLGCRIYHLTVANKNETNAKTHCLHGKVESDTCK